MLDYTKTRAALRSALASYTGCGYTEVSNPERIWPIYDKMAVASARLQDTAHEIEYYEKAIHIVMTGLRAAPMVSCLKYIYVLVEYD